MSIKLYNNLNFRCYKKSTYKLIVCIILQLTIRIPVIKRETIVCSWVMHLSPYHSMVGSQVVNFSEIKVVNSKVSCVVTKNATSLTHFDYALFTNSETTFDSGHRIVCAKMHLTAKIFPFQKWRLHYLFFLLLHQHAVQYLYWNSLKVLDNSVMHCESGLICRWFTILRITKNQR